MPGTRKTARWWHIFAWHVPTHTENSHCWLSTYSEQGAPSVLSSSQRSCRVGLPSLPFCQCGNWGREGLVAEGGPGARPSRWVVPITSGYELCPHVEVYYALGSLGLGTGPCLFPPGLCHSALPFLGVQGNGPNGIRSALLT